MCKVSLIIPAYNVEKFIGKCLENCLEQTYSNIEIIVINDGSTDQTKKVIDEYKEKDNRVILIDKKNEGVSEARISGFNKATGDYILFIDSDDWLELNAIELLVNKQKESQVDIICYDYKIIDENGKVEGKKDSIDKENFLKSILIGDSPYFWIKFIKRDFIISNNIKFPQKIGYCEDLAFSVSLAASNPKVEKLTEYLYCYYQRSNSVTKKINKNILDIKIATEFIIDILKSKNLYDDFQ